MLQEPFILFFCVRSEDGITERVLLLKRYSWSASRVTAFSFVVFCNYSTAWQCNKNVNACRVCDVVQRLVWSEQHWHQFWQIRRHPSWSQWRKLPWTHRQCTYLQRMPSFVISLVFNAAAQQQMRAVSRRQLGDEAEHRLVLLCSFRAVCSALFSSVTSTLATWSDGTSSCQGMNARRRYRSTRYRQSWASATSWRVLRQVTVHRFSRNYRD